jgi:hypothetical protein
MRSSLFQVQMAEKIRDYCNIGECFELKEEYYKKAIVALGIFILQSMIHHDHRTYSKN